jgi:two-component system response regulator AtoC
MAHTLLFPHRYPSGLSPFDDPDWQKRGGMVTRSNENLLSEVGSAPQFGQNQYFVPGASASMRALELTIADIAPTEMPVLLLGESGTGKEVMALQIHRLSGRSDGVFVKCGCAGLTAESLTARLNGGNRSKADGATTSGSLFLDEVSNLDLASQSRLLDLLSEGPEVQPQNCLCLRIISSSTRSLEAEMRSGRFHQELYYRISGVSLHLPPLRQRKEDISELLAFFLKKYASLFGWPEPQLSSATMDLLMRHSWPGNIRELENVARKIVALGNEQLAMGDLQSALVPKGPELAQNSSVGNAQSLKVVSREASRRAEREMILKQLEVTRWNRKKTARDLQISYKALLYKLKQLGLDGSGNSNGQ